jgi:hypothetical protein
MVMFRFWILVVPTLVRERRLYLSASRRYRPAKIDDREGDSRAEVPDRPLRQRRVAPADR